MVTLFKQLPPLEALAATSTDANGNVPVLKLEVPHTFEDVRIVRQTLELYRLAYARHVTLLLTAAYLFLQSFMMPGSLGINILIGSLYPTFTAFMFVIAVSTLGASMNFMLTRWLLRDIIVGLFPNRIKGFQGELQRHQAHLLNYMLFIRVTPILPAWFVNLASPVVGIPYPIFIIATAVGHVPINFLTVHAGATLQTIHSMQDLYSVRNVVFMMTVGVLALVPVVWRRRQAARAAGQQQRLGGKAVPVIDRGAYAIYVRS